MQPPELAVKDAWTKQRMRGGMTAMWYPSIEKYRETNLDGIRFLGEALKKHGFK